MNRAVPDGPFHSLLIGVVVVTHGQLATELVNAAEMIVGDLPQFAAVSIGWHDEHYLLSAIGDVGGRGAAEPVRDEPSRA